MAVLHLPLHAHGPGGRRGAGSERKRGRAGPQQAARPACLAILLRHCELLPPAARPTVRPQNPLAYGINWEEVSADPALEGHRRRLVTEAARELERAKMARFDERSGNLYVTGGRGEEPGL